jgi:hypothetical protein
MPNSANLGQIINNPDYVFTIDRIEDPEVRSSRLRREEADARWGRWKEGFLLVFVATGVGVVVYYCFSVVTSPASTADDKKWATSILTAIVSGAVGVLTGKKIQ